MKTFIEKFGHRTLPLIICGAVLLGGLYIISTALYKKFEKGGAHYPFVLPKLPYAYNALEPYIDTLTMQLHHDKHHRKYVDELNAALKDHPELHSKTLEQLLENLDALPESIRMAVRNNGGGDYNHSFFWTIMAPQAGGEPTGVVLELINTHFKDFPTFKQQFEEAAKKVFGSGWAWLVMNKQGQPSIITTANQDSPISQGLIPLLGLDVWEHAYYLKYHNKRPDYIDAWWHVVNWKAVEHNAQKAQASHLPPK